MDDYDIAMTLWFDFSGKGFGCKARETLEGIGREVNGQESHEGLYGLHAYAFVGIWRQANKICLFACMEYLLAL